jgi:magnesium-transporting ATPase (P-type)
MIIIELILLFTGYNISFILNDARIYVNFTFFLIDFIVFLAYLIKIRRSYELRREFRNEPLIFCPGLKKQLSKYSTKRQRLIDSLFRNIFSFTFVVLTVSIYLFIIFSQAISAGNSPINGIINGTGFHAGYISLIILAILLEFLLLHWNKAMKRKEKEIVP